MCRFRCWFADSNRSARKMCVGAGGVGTCAFGLLLRKIVDGDVGMRVVLVKSPRFLGGILRKMFGIGKENYIQ